MATIIKRGSRTAPKFFVKFDVGVTADGKRVQRVKLLPGGARYAGAAAASRCGRTRDRSWSRPVSGAGHRPRFGRHAHRPLGRGPWQQERIQRSRDGEEPFLVPMYRACFDTLT
jgi:hypothetical protein